MKTYIRAFLGMSSLLLMTVIRRSIEFPGSTFTVINGEITFAVDSWTKFFKFEFNSSYKISLTMNRVHV